jgi:hypothetical protein
MYKQNLIRSGVNILDQDSSRLYFVCSRVRMFK